MPLLRPPYPKLQRDHPLAQGIVAGWMMGEGAGNRLLDVVGRFNATLVASPSWAASPFGSSISLNGSSQYASVTGTLWTPGTANQSWLAWVIPASTAVGFIAGMDNFTGTAVQFMVNATSNASNNAGFWTFGIKSFDASQLLLSYVASNVVTVGKTWFLAGVRTGTQTLAMYRNGVRETITNTDTVAASAPALSNVVIGTRLYAGGINFFNGQVLQVLHFNRALLPEEISLYNFDPFAPFRSTPRKFYFAAIPGNAVGDTVSAATTLLSGTATGGAAASGSTISAATTLLSGTATGTATASGGAMSASAILSDGTGTGAAAALGTTLAAAASIVDGTASGVASTAGSIVTAAATLVDGLGTGEAMAVGDVVTATAVVVDGEAVGTAIADGTLLELTTVIIGGIATGEGLATGDIVGVVVTIIPGTAGAVHTGLIIELTGEAVVRVALLHGETETDTILVGYRSSAIALTGRRDTQ